MPLVKNARITTDLFVHVADGAELPGDGAILVSAARFLEDPEAVLKHAGKVGVVEDIVQAYVELRARPDELFIDTFERVGVEPFKERVYATR